MKIYIAGKITGDKFYKWKFAKAERQLRRLGHSVMNPARLAAYAEFSYWDYMRISGVMQEACDAVLFLPGWTESRGAWNEYARAVERKQRMYFDVKTIFVNEWPWNTL